MTSPASQAVDAHLFPRRLSHLLSSKPDSPIYIDLPSVSPATFSRTRQRPAKSRSLLDYLARSGTSAKHHDEVDEVLGALQRRDVRSAAGEVERLRLIKSEAEVKVMRRAADASSAAHAKVRSRPLASWGSPHPPSHPPFLTRLVTPRTGHALRAPRHDRTPSHGPLRVPRLAAGRRARGLRPRVRRGQAGAHDPLPRQQPPREGGRTRPPRCRVRVGRVRERHYPCVAEHLAPSLSLFRRCRDPAAFVWTRADL